MVSGLMSGQSPVSTDEGTVEAGESVGAGEHRARRAVLHFLHHDLRVALN